MKIKLNLFVSPTCTTCSKVKRDLLDYFGNENKVKIKIFDISKIRKAGVVIVPALFVDEELYSYGEFNLEKLNSFIESKRNNQ